jgi:hypothetical protein
MTFSYSIRVKFGIGILVLFSLLSIFQLLVKAFRFDFQFIEIDQYESRFEDIKKEIPERGVFGYVTDKSQEEISSDVESLTLYYLTQYTLTPRMIINSAKGEYVVGNFYDAIRSKEVLKEKNLTLIKDFGNGVMLFKGKEK